MSTLDKITYPFRLAAWKANHFVNHPDQNTSHLNMGKTALAIAIASSIGGYSIANVEPDATPINGQNEIIAEYTNKIMSIDSKQEASSKKLTKAWQEAEGDTKAFLFEQVENIKGNNYRLEYNLLADIYKEDRVSEVELKKLSEFFYDNVESDTLVHVRGISDIGDGAYLHECQNKTSDAVDVVGCSIDKEAEETKNRIILPILAFILGGFSYGFSFAMYEDTDLNRRLTKLAEKPKPRVKRSISPY